MTANGAGATERQEDWTVQSVVGEFVATGELSRRKLAFLESCSDRFWAADKLEQVPPELLETGPAEWTRELLNKWRSQNGLPCREGNERSMELITQAALLLDLGDDLHRWEEVEMHLFRLHQPEAWAAFNREDDAIRVAAQAAA